MIWLSPAYPVGGYSYSHGLEWAVEAGQVTDAATLGCWIEDLLMHGAGRTDVIFLAEAWRAMTAGDTASLRAVAELAAAFAPSAERRLETLAQGTAFLAATLAAWSTPALAALSADAREIAYPVAVGAAAAAHGLPLAETAQAFAQAFAANLVSAGVRLIPLGQSDGLRVLARLEPLIPQVVTSGARRRPRRRRRRRDCGRHRLHAPRDAVHAAVPVMIATLAVALSAVVFALAVLHAYWGLGGIWPAASAEHLAKAAVGTPGITSMPGRLACFAGGGAARWRWRPGRCSRRAVAEAWPRWLTLSPAPASPAVSSAGG